MSKKDFAYWVNLELVGGTSGFNEDTVSFRTYIKGKFYNVHHAEVPNTFTNILVVHGPIDGKDPRWYFNEFESERKDMESEMPPEYEREILDAVQEAVQRKNRVAGSDLEFKIMKARQEARD